MANDKPLTIEEVLKVEAENKKKAEETIRAIETALADKKPEKNK